MKLNKYHSIYLYILLILSSCTEKNPNTIFIDLNKSMKILNYSSIFKDIEYINLDVGDECILSGIKKICFDSDTIILQDSKSEGIFIFDKKESKLVSHINKIGQGPEEYHKDNAIAVDTVCNYIHIYDMMNFKVNIYSYKGEYISSYKTDYFMRDFAWINNKLLIIQPCINKVYKRNGVWFYSPKDKKETLLLEHNGDDQYFEFMSTYIEQTGDNIYYYDRNDDCIYLIKNDSLSKLYEIDLKQKISLDTRIVSAPKPEELNQKSMMFDFSPSSHCFLICYFIFGEKENPYRYVLIDSKTKEKRVFNHLINDMDSISFSDNKIFCINEQSWCRLSCQPENSKTVQLQVMYLRTSDFTLFSN